MCIEHFEKKNRPKRLNSTSHRRFGKSQETHVKRNDDENSRSLVQSRIYYMEKSDTCHDVQTDTV